MNKIVKKKQLSAEVFEIEVEAPLIAQNRKAGQFIIVQIDSEWGERIPLTIADADPNAGTITMVFQTVGAPSFWLSFLGWLTQQRDDFVGGLADHDAR